MKLEVYTNDALRKVEYPPSTPEYKEILEKINSIIELDFEPLTVGYSNGEFAAYSKVRNSKFLTNLKTVTVGEGFGIKFKSPNDIRVKVYHLGNPRHIKLAENILFTGMYDESTETTVYYLENGTKISPSQVLVTLGVNNFIGVTVDADGKVISKSHYNSAPSMI
jgi:hypothetical protein